MKPELGLGVYSISEAGQLAAVNSATVRAWFFSDKSNTRTPVLKSDYSPYNDRFAISFLDLVDLAAIGELRRIGISLQNLRKIHADLSDHLETRHPFSREEFYTDGSSVFTKTINDLGDTHLIEAVSRQEAIPDILLNFLDKFEYMDSVASRWNIFHGVVVDPCYQFGKPIVEAIGINTYILATAAKANSGDTELVAELYGITKNDVQLAIDFERFIANDNGFAA